MQIQKVKTYSLYPGVPYPREGHDGQYLGGGQFLIMHSEVNPVQNCYGALFRLDRDELSIVDTFMCSYVISTIVSMGYKRFLYGTFYRSGLVGYWYAGNFLNHHEWTDHRDTYQQYVVGHDIYSLEPMGGRTILSGKAEAAEVWVNRFTRDPQAGVGGATYSEKFFDLPAGKRAQSMDWVGDQLFVLLVNPTTGTSPFIRDYANVVAVYRVSRGEAFQVDEVDVSGMLDAGVAPTGMGGMIWDGKFLYLIQNGCSADCKMHVHKCLINPR